MRLKQALIFALLIVLVRSKSADYTCAHDGYSNPDAKCECTSSTYKGSKFNFYSGNTCNTIECTNSGVRISDEFDDLNQRCACPPGFLGTHCEPTHCVPGALQSFDEVSHGRDVAVIITYNKEFQDQLLNKDKNPNLPKTICDSITVQNGVTKDSKITFWLMESYASTTSATCEDDVKDALELCTPVTVGKDTVRSCEGDLTTSYILEALETMAEDSRLIILSNEGIQDKNPEAGIEAIRKKTISLRIQIHSIVLSPRDPNPNSIYFKGEFNLLRDLSESTLGFFITPFDASGGQKIGENGMTDILTKMMPVFFEYVVVDRITTSKDSCDQPADFTVFRTMEENPLPFWLTVTSSASNFDAYSTAWIPITPALENATIDAGFFKAYTLPATTGEVVALKPTNKMGKKCVPTTVLHLARFAITNDDAIDASSPYAISGAGATNTLVGHFVNYFHDDHLKSLFLEFSNEEDFKADLKQEPLPRDCQYNAKFSDLTCDEGKNTLIRVRDKDSGAAVTVQSLYCTEPETAAPMPKQDDFASFNSITGDAVDECKPSGIEVQSGKRTLILAAHATETIYKLFNGNSKSAIKYLNDLNDLEYYQNYVVNIFNANDGTDAQSSKEYDEFKATLMDKWNNVYHDAGKLDKDCTATVTDDATGKTISPLDTILPLVDILSPGTVTSPNSDIIYIVDQAIRNPDASDTDDVKFKDELKTLQRQMYQKRLRLIVLLLGCDDVDFNDSPALKKWNDVATKTGGFMVHFKQPEDLNLFLNSYVDWVKGETAAAIDGRDQDNLGFSMSQVTSTPFQVQKDREYTILVNILPSVSQVDVVLATGVETIDRADLLGNSLAIFKYKALYDGVLAIRATPLPYFFYSSFRVLEVTDTDFATIGFTEATCLDSTFPDLNPKKPQIPVTSTVENANVSMTIFTSDGSVLRTGVSDEQGTNYPMHEYNWRCNDQDNVFYISTDVVTDDSTFTRVITTQCFGSGKPDDMCINGDYNDGTKCCNCPHDYTGCQCDRPVCQNGGVVTASLECDCTGTDYEGQFCQKFSQCSGLTLFTPAYKSIANTIIFLVEKSEFVIARIKKLTKEDLFISVRAAQYLIVEYGPVSNYTVRISTTDKDLLYAELHLIEAVEDPQVKDPSADKLFFDAIPAIKAALQAQTTDSAHLFWFAQDDSVDDFVTEVFEPIAANRVSISAFFGKSKLDSIESPVHPVTLTGGSIFYSDKSDGDYVDIFEKYIVRQLAYAYGFEQRPNVLSISIDSTDKAVHTFNIDQTVSQLFIAAYDTLSIDLKKTPATTISGSVPIPGGFVYDTNEVAPLAAGEYTVTITYADALINRTSSVIALTQNQVAYGFYRSDESDTFMDSAMMGDNVLVTYWMSEGTNYAPTAVITPLSVGGVGEPVELYMTVRDACSYTLSVPVNCTGEADAYGVKITNSIINKGGSSETKVDKYIPVLCMAAHSCHNGGQPTDSGCSCGYFYDGLYCEIDKCTNGEKTGGKCVCNTGYSGEFCDTFTKPSDRSGMAFLFIQDVCGDNDKLKDAAQSVYVDYLALLKTADKFYLATNEQGTKIQPIAGADLQKALDANRAAAAAPCDPTIGDALDAFYNVLRNPNLVSFAAEAASDPSVGKANVAYVTTVSADSNKGTNLLRLENDYTFNAEFIGITEKNVYFPDPEAFDDFPGEFLQTYDPEVALLDLVNTFGSDTKPVIPSGDSIPRCIKDLQAVFAFHTDISSVPNMKEYRSKASQVIGSVTKYFTVAADIDNDEDTCEYNKDQEKDKTLFSGTMYCNGSAIAQAKFCSSNMATYPGQITTVDYKQAPQVNLQAVVDTYAKTYDTDMKMKCHCFDYANPDTTQIILWTPLSPTSLDTAPVSFDGFNKGGANFKHIVMPFGFNFKDSPLWNRLVPEEQWLTDASQANYDVNQIIQDIWTITCRLAGKIEDKQTAEPFNPYTTRKPRVGEDTWKDDDGANGVNTDPPVGPQ